MIDKADFLNQVITPDEVARRITETSGVHMTGRTVWEKARRLGIARKLGRSMFILIDDIPKLLEIEPTRSERAKQLARDRLSESHKNAALKIIAAQKAAKKLRRDD